MRWSWMFVALLASTAVAQTVYESKERSGVPEFSDQPAPGAAPIELPPPNVIQVPKTPEGTAQPAAKPAPAAYQSLRIVSPQNDGTIHSNTGQFDIKVALDPALRKSRGDAFVLKLNGAPLRRKFKSSTLHVLAEDWQSVPPTVAETQVQVSVVNQAGEVLIDSAPVQFFLRHSVRH